MGEVTEYARDMVTMIDDRAIANDVIAVNILSLLIHNKFPMIPQEERRELAKRIVAEDRERRKAAQRPK